MHWIALVPHVCLLALLVARLGSVATAVAVVALLLLSAGPGAAGAATVSTNSPSYLLRDTPSINGSGFQFGETVQLQVLHTDGTPNTGAGHAPWLVTDGGAGDLDGQVNGNIQTTWAIPQDDSAGSAFAVTAAGQTSGATAQAAFTVSNFFGSVFNTIVASPGGNPSGSACVTRLQSDLDGSPPYGYLTFIPTGTLTFSQITNLNAVFSFPVGNYGGGSPRFEIPLDTDGDGLANGSVFVYLGTPPNFTDPGHTAFISTGNVILDLMTTRWDLAQFGGPFNGTYAQALALLGTARVLDVELVVDGGWFSGDQVALVDSFTVNDKTYLTSCVPDGEFCPKTSVLAVLDPTTGRFPNNLGPDAIVRTHVGQSVQAAIDAATDVNSDGYIIVGVVANDGASGGHATQSIVIDRTYPSPFALIGCSVTLHDASRGDSQPTARITAGAGSPNNIFVMDLHAAGSDTAGWLVEGNGRTLRNVQTASNAVGLWIRGNGNTAQGGSAGGNTGAGILVAGNNNIVADNDATNNGSHGIAVTGNANTLLKNDSGEPDGNGGDGINVNGAGNLLQENDAFGNAGNGIVVAGGTAASPNVLKRNRAGEKGKGNAGDGFLIGGAGNGASNPVEIVENQALANGGHGFNVTGTRQQIKSNQSGGDSANKDNGGCEYLTAAGNFNSGGNKANNVTVNLRIPGCTGTP